MQKYKLILLFCSFLLCAISNGQERESYDLSRYGDHLFFDAEICGEQAEIMVESGIPALLIGRDFYERAIVGGNLAFEPSQAKIRLLNNTYGISFRTKGALLIGSARYEGPIFILDGYDGISVPIQNLHDCSGRRVVSVDLSNGRLSIGGPNESSGKCFKLRLDKKTGFPIVNTKVAISSQGQEAILKGNLIVDFGNPMLVFLMSQHKSVCNAIVKGKITPQDARDPNGNVVAQGVYAETVTIGGKTYEDVSIGITGAMNSIEEMGFLGLPFFSTVVTFDFDKGKMFVY